MPGFLTIPLKTRTSILRYILGPNDVYACEAHIRDAKCLRIPHYALRWTQSLPLYLICRQIRNELKALRPPKASLTFCISTCAARFLNDHLDDNREHVCSLHFSTFVLPHGETKSVLYENPMVEYWRTGFLDCLGWTQLEIEDIAENISPKLITLSP